MSKSIVHRSRIARDRVTALSTEHRIRYAAGRGYRVLPISDPLEGWIVAIGDNVIARCNLLLEAAEVAAALAHYAEIGRP